MRKRLPIKTLLFSGTLLVLLTELFSVLPAKTKSARVGYGGAIHVHSEYSHDGGGSVSDIARAAKQAGMQFVIITDHNNSLAAKNGDTILHGVDVFVESENSLELGHVLSFFRHTSLSRKTDQERKSLANKWTDPNAELPKDAFQLVAHPTNPKRPWTKLESPLQGMEVMNLDSQWRKSAKRSLGQFILTALIYPLNPYLSYLRVFRGSAKNFEIWDHQNIVRPPYPGILGHDTHQHIPLTKNWAIPWPSYRETFKLARNRILAAVDAPTLSGRRAQLYKAIRLGKLAIVLDSVFPHADKINWQIQCPTRTAYVGETISHASGCTSSLLVPVEIKQNTSVRQHIWRNGKRLATLESAEELFKLKEPGSYRMVLETHRRSLFGLLLDRWVPVAIFNHIHLE